MCQVKVGDISSYEASPERKTLWLQQTGTPFDPLDAAQEMTHLEVDCPKCFTRVTVREYIIVVGWSLIVNYGCSIHGSGRYGLFAATLCCWVPELQVLDHERSLNHAQICP